MDKGRASRPPAGAKARLTKQQIRSKILLKLKTQKEESRERKSRVIKNKLFRSAVFRKAKKIMFYIAFGGEVNTAEMIAGARKLGKMIAVPLTKRGGGLRPVRWEPGARVVKGPYGVAEPVMRMPVNIRDIDIVIVPGIAFDKKGNRLSRGKGCYDRFLKELLPKALAIGLAYNFQVLPFVHTVRHDMRVNRLIYAS
ncbi:MAG: 5-formyltetrahydrofolate cyclo-ligase [Candidatus Omnitrophica bacterium]|nr:5-formyltetrahydrofolate cyclo-ligase [Candidatus Omnitrophota bacterium]